MLCAALFAFAPATGAPDARVLTRPAVMSGGVGYFTPASADPKLAAIFARGGLNNRGFRFTPIAVGKNRAVTVAVRSTSGNRALVANRTAQQADAVAASESQSIGVRPVSYSLGAAVGWKHFALSSDVSRIEAGPTPAARERADLGISYSSRKWSTRVAVGAERPVGRAPRMIAGGESYSLDVGGAYRLTRNLDVTAGVRYRSDRDRLQQTQDERRDSQAVYVGTAFRF